VRAVAFVALFSSACAVLTNLGDLKGDAGATDAAIDVGGDASTDVIVTDAVSDVASETSVDAGPCVATPLIGSNDLSPLTNDYISQGALDVIRFTSQGGGVARCAWLYVQAIDPQVSSVFVAAYDMDGLGNPSNRVATASLSAPPKVGWNSATLDAPLKLDAGQALWIGAVSPTGNLPVLDTNQCSAANSVREQQPVTVPPAKFVQTATFPACDMGIYLGP